MQPEFKNKILEGDALTVLKTLPSESVDCICTSPPYWSLRDYKVDGQIGNEKTIDEYITNLIQIFNECKRILKREGTCWVVLGDTYAGSGGAGGDYNEGGLKEGQPKYRQHKINLPQKSLCLIPERFALKMIENKWILRNKIIWYKPNCMPSSAKDRYTVDYENIYFFTKSQKYYFKTQYEQALETSWATNTRKNRGTQEEQGPKFKERSKNSYNKIHGVGWYPLGRIKRCIWKIATSPMKEAHFAVFPPELVKQCLDAGCPPNGITLDMFMGSGTVALVALKNAMNFVGIELNPNYIEIANKRIEPYLKQEKLTQFTR